MPQNYGLFPHLPVARQVRFAVGSDPALAQHWLDRLGLAGLEHRLPDALSLGQRQRVALARAFSRPADLLLLDEPFSALDAPLRARLRREFRTLQADVDATTILVTHDPEEAFLLADELLILDAGRVLQAGPGRSGVRAPRERGRRQAAGCRQHRRGAGPRLRTTSISATAFGSPSLGPALQNDANVGWSVRPESIRITPGGTTPE